MEHNSFTFKTCKLPFAANRERAALGFELWREAIEQSGSVSDSAQIRALLEPLFAASPFLTQCATLDPIFTCHLMNDGPDDAFISEMSTLDKAHEKKLDEIQLAKALRIAKRRIALSIAIADISGAWPLEKVTKSLTEFADKALSLATACMLRDAQKTGALTLAHEDDPEKESGLIILAMGKMGAFELNYSSDIDLIVLYDPEKVQTDSPDRLQKNMVRLTRNIMRLMDDRTADGYVFRTDLRIRPDPGATPVAIPLPAAEIYYETLGQNWERAAMIKARPAAGDIQAGEAFIKWLEPFIWRKNLDFATIQDIHSIKRQINTQRNHTDISLAGHDVKLGHGGIREIEFFVQTQQLIWGGRKPNLRCATTIGSLKALSQEGHITDEVAQEMIRAYEYLRKVEHRVQMINDEQTHQLPKDDEPLKELAIFLGYLGCEDFATELTTYLRVVQSNYAILFDDHPSLGAECAIDGNLVFTGAEQDPETQKTLENLGFHNAKTVDDTIRMWHHGRYRSTRSTRTRAILTELMPLLLKALSDTSDPDGAFLKFDAFLSRLPSGVQVFSMLRANPNLLNLLAEIIGDAPRLSSHLSRNPSILDSVLAGGFFDLPPGPEELEAELTENLEHGEILEDMLDISRRWASDRKFQVGVQILRGLLSPRAAAEALSNIADSAIRCLAPCVEKEFCDRHGVFPDSGMVVAAMGKLGGREMTPVSDLDLIFIYTTDSTAEFSDGPRPLSPSQYFSRLSQRLINALSAQTAEGRLYEVDMRLRPSGKAGPIASSLQAYQKYQAESAWTWEHMALTRARVIAGPKKLQNIVDEAFRGTLLKARDSDALRKDVAEMRARMDEEHHTQSPWEIKHLRGGLVDIEFIAQYLQLKHASTHPDILSPNTREALERIRDAGLLDNTIANDLIEALDFWQGLQLVLRLSFDGPVQEGPSIGFQNKVSEIVAPTTDGAPLKERIFKMAKRTHNHFNDLI